jgi:hypothetical protein
MLIGPSPREEGIGAQTRLAQPPGVWTISHFIFWGKLCGSAPWHITAQARTGYIIWKQRSVNTQGKPRADVKYVSIPSLQVSPFHPFFASELQ